MSEALFPDPSTTQPPVRSRTDIYGLDDVTAPLPLKGKKLLSCVSHYLWLVTLMYEVRAEGWQHPDPRVACWQANASDLAAKLGRNLEDDLGHALGLEAYALPIIGTDAIQAIVARARPWQRTNSRRNGKNFPNHWTRNRPT